jgi:hypothetical protein
LTRFTAFSIQALSLLVLGIVASMNWASIELTAQLEVAPIGVTGFAAFPAIGSLIALQAASMFLSTQIAGWVPRLLCASLVPLMSWLLVVVLETANAAIDQEVSRVVLESTGLAGELGQQEIIQSSEQSLVVVIFAVALVVNILILAAKAVWSPGHMSSKSRSREAYVSEDLWSSQR